MKILAKKIFLTLLILNIFCINLFSQKNNSENKTDTLVNVNKAIRTADLYFSNMKYGNAIIFYQYAISSFVTDADLNYKLAECYYFSDRYIEAIKYFEKAKDLNYSNSPELEFYLADCCRQNYQFDKAIEIYIGLLKICNEEKKIKVEKKIEECKNGIEITKDTSIFKITDLDQNLNSKFSDYGLFFLQDTNLIIFTSKKSNSTGNQINPYDGQYNEDVYFSNIVNSKISENYNAGNKINTYEPDACVGVSKNRKSFYIYKDENGGDLFEITYSNNKWQNPVNLSFINSSFTETSISISKDEKFIYFVSNRLESIGRKDIFVVEKNGENTYSNPVNLGEKINTIYDEESLYISDNNDTLYFSSEGHNSMGSYDIFRCVKDNAGNWQNPENLGVPFNSPNADLYFFPRNEKYYLTSTREGTIGKSDIYEISIKTYETNIAQILEINNADTLSDKNKLTINTNLSGYITDAFSNPLEAEIIWGNLVSREKLGSIRSNSSGYYFTQIPVGYNCGIYVIKENYYPDSGNIDLTNIDTILDIEKNFTLINIVELINTNVSIPLTNIFFETNKFDLKPESYAELNRLADFLKDYDDIKIEISGHTDNTGSSSFNQKLSENRAKSVRDYLILQGCYSVNLKAVGYGFTNPLVENDSEENKAKNRRVEFKVLKD
jgi:outer membrane protein OmpA-like peptidoglycan-associated protein